MSTPHISTEDSAASPILLEIEPSANNTNEATQNNNEQQPDTIDEDDESPYAPKKRKWTSKVWDDFKEVTLPDGTIKAECIYCKHLLTINKTGVTSHFLRHLKGCMRKHISDKGQKNISVTTTIVESKTVNAVQNFKYDHGKIREILSHMIIVHELPFLFSEYEMFNLLMRTATLYYQKISRTTVKKDCTTSYEIEKKKVMESLKDVNRVSVTIDLWKSDQKVSYMVVTCHYVDSSWNLQKWNLNFLDVPPPHNGVSICDVLNKCLVEWGIENKVWLITVDNASYNDVAVRMLKDNLSYKNNLPLGGKLFHVRCCAHILNLLVQDGLSEIQDIIFNVRESVKHIAASETRVNIFSEISKQLKLSSKKLVLDCCTRWNATFCMLSAALEFKDIFPRYAARDATYTFLPSEEDWKKLNEASVDEGSFIVEMVNKMKTKFDKYWGDSNLLISIAAVLNPRNKMKLIEWCFPEIYSVGDTIEHISMVHETLHMLHNEYVEAHKTSVDSINVQSETQRESSIGRSNLNGRGRGKVRAQFSSYIKNVDSVEQVKSELEVYLDEGCVICEDETDFDALSWWRINNLKFRILSKMACDVLSIPITTVASESAFSAGGRVIDPHHASLGTDTVQILFCASDWLRAHYGIKKKIKGDFNELDFELNYVHNELELELDYVPNELEPNELKFEPNELV
ncbi:zinc finger BED domain-containing protein RICESLEEPER 2-like [Zingiber officinale]|uniref:zinc finger BED domain-containing protein RICESLEEPER 2-like n=1 Tax=Zingiber officinale TaxID=94328 RepID=UPI001C4CC862|nr:zinc finger BED domain-containing protein RICESLEEPER 2-like [Zingiber officinale]